VPRFFFNLHDDVECRDDEGFELPSAAAALRRAADAAREIGAKSIREGHWVLDHRIVICDERGSEVGTVLFRDVVRVTETA
jgi:hypothetical protein